MTMIVSLECHALIILHRCRERCEGAAASASTSSPHGHSSASAIALASAFISIGARIPDEVSLSGHTVKPWWSDPFLLEPGVTCARPTSCLLTRLAQVLSSTSRRRASHTRARAAAVRHASTFRPPALRPHRRASRSAGRSIRAWSSQSVCLW